MSVHKRLGVSRGNWIFAWIIIGLAVAGNIAGYVFNLYQRWWAFDDVIHGYTLFAITVVLGLLAYRGILFGFERHTFLLILTITSFGIALGALWELIEWWYDMFAPGNVIRGKHDTMVDLVADCIGAVVAAVTVYFSARKKPAGQDDRQGS